MTEFEAAAVLIYVTVGSDTEARGIATRLVEERLAACANILPGMVSIYRWKDAIESADEVVLIVKTRAMLFDAVAARIRDLHSYDTPCILEIPLGRGDPSFLAWLAGETAQPVTC